MLPGGRQAGKILYGGRGPYGDRHAVAEAGVSPGDRGGRRRRQGLGGEQVTDARGGHVERGGVGPVEPATLL